MAVIISYNKKPLDVTISGYISVHLLALRLSGLPDFPLLQRTAGLHDANERLRSLPAREAGIIRCGTEAAIADKDFLALDDGIANADSFPAVLSDLDLVNPQSPANDKNFSHRPPSCRKKLIDRG
jgi:hypothetical protein